MPLLYNATSNRAKDEALNDLRRERDARLAVCDWTQNIDVAEPVQTMWQPYRQALRDITNTYSSLDDVVWPDTPV